MENSIKMKNKFHNSSKDAFDVQYQNTDISLLIQTSRFAKVNSSVRVRTMNISSQPFIEEKSMNIINTDHVFGLLENERDLTLINPSSEQELFIEFSNKLTPREIFQHNNMAGCNEWGIYKGKIYNNTQLKHVFSHLTIVVRNKDILEHRLMGRKPDSETELTEQRDYIDTKDSYDNLDSRRSSICDINLEDTDILIANWTKWLLKNGLSLSEIESHALSCCVGSLVQPTDSEYWDDIRSDIIVVLDDLINEDFRDTISIYKTDYMNLLLRWIKKYKNQNPDNSQHKGSDSNESQFPLPADVQDNLVCLRPWLENWKRFDFDIPDTGAWDVTDVESIDLGDSHEILLSILKSHVDLSPLETSITGETAWDVIQEGLFANDEMTDAQKIIEQKRRKRKDFYDPNRMKKRRQQIMDYFINKYRFEAEKVNHFLNWATEMKNGDDLFHNSFRT